MSQETGASDCDLKYKIQPIELVKHNPNLFWTNPLKFGSFYDILGGNKFGVCALTGMGLATGYFNASKTFVKVSFYQRIFNVWGRVLFGGLIGGYIGYQKFGDKQRMHNLYTADRLYRRYPDSKNITATNIEQHRGQKAPQEYYRWA